jgi:hypothetical protein
VDIDEVIARLEIQDVLWRYARGVDRSDLAAIVSAYHPDATDEHPQMSGPARDVVSDFVGRDELMSMVGQHHITNLRIELDDADHARVESYFLAFHPHEGGRPVRMGIAAGRYLDDFERRDGRWRIRVRRIVMDWTRDDLGGDVWPGVEGRPTPGRRMREDDASYAFFGAVAGDPPVRID